MLSALPHDLVSLLTAYTTTDRNAATPMLIEAAVLNWPERVLIIHNHTSMTSSTCRADDLIDAEKDMHASSCEGGDPPWIMQGMGERISDR